MKGTPRKEEPERWKHRSTPLPHIRELRQTKGLTQRELAALAGVSTGTVYRLETGRRGAYPVTVRKLASALGVAPEALVRRLEQE